MRAKDASSIHHDSLPPSRRRQFCQKLLRWFDRHRRDLPWRRDRDPYHIWVSEVMLQQTQVATVIRYFEPFIRDFPSIQALAAANEQDVLRRWEGMGYYRRARHLHQAAKQLTTQYEGRIPDDPEVFGNLPGVGRYILGAVLSQAFDRRLPIVEANSRRVLYRLYASRIGREPQRIAPRLWKAAGELLPTRRVGDFNQALMELGALVCTPRAPQCGVCPISDCCEAKRKGLQESIPHRPITPKQIAVIEVAVVIRRADRVLLVQRPLGGRWGGLWEFLHDKIRFSESYKSAARRIVRSLVGLRIQLSGELLTVQHTVTRNQITLVGFEARYVAGKFRSDFYCQGRWVPPTKLYHFPISAPHRKLAMTLLSGGR